MELKSEYPANTTNPIEPPTWLRLANFARVWLMLSVLPASAATRYVDLNSTNPVSPYASWSTAATNIQDAIDASTNGDLVLVTNGIYAVGGKSMDGVITNRVSVDKAITVQSVNGPFVTVIRGAGMSNGLSAVRCTWLTNDAALVGFTLEWGGTRVSPSNAGRGGGVWCTSSDATVANCLILSNTAFQYGGGDYQGTLDNCLISRNSRAQAGSAAYLATLNNCTVVSNGTINATAASILTNCIVFYNAGANFSGGTFSYCCTTPLPSGPGNFTDPPQLFVDGIHLTSTSPCIGAGTNVTTGTDIFGEAWANPPSIGCAEWQPAPVLMPLQIHLTGSPVGFLVGSPAVNGQPPFGFQWFKHGMPLQDNGHFSGSQMTNLVASGIVPSDAGGYEMVMSNAFGMVTSTVAQLVMHFVDAASENPQPPYTNWSTAAANIQDAIDATAAGEIVMVTNGLYATGGRIMPSSSTNRAVLDKALAVVSVNGYSTTTIQGAWDPVNTNGPLAVRCVWLTNNAILCGFTLQNGATGNGGLVGGSTESGGGVWCASTNAVVSNCELTNNSAVFGAGACSGTLNNCFLIANTAFDYGGGALAATLNNCTVVGNYCNFSGPGPRWGAGGYDCVAKNSILWNNYSWAPQFQLYFYPDNYGNDSSQLNPQYTFAFCDTDPLLANTGNIDASPQFLSSFHLATTSPCRGAGSAVYASGTDLDGEAWANPPSIGCDEVIVSNLVGPLSVNVQAALTNLLVNRDDFFTGSINGRAASATWSFGDGPTFTSLGTTASHAWTNAGDYTVTFAAYNNDNPDRVSASVVIDVLPLAVPQLQSSVLLTNGFQFQFSGQLGADYTIQYATNLASPVTWQTLQTIPFSSTDVIQIIDSTPTTNSARFYRVLAQ